MYKAKVYWIVTDDSNKDHHKVNSLVGVAKGLPTVGEDFELDLTDINKIVVQFGKVTSVQDNKGLIYFISDFGSFEFLILDKVGEKTNVINFPKRRSLEHN